MYSPGRIMSCIRTMRITNRKGAKDAKEGDFFRIGTSRRLRLPTSLFELRRDKMARPRWRDLRFAPTRGRFEKDSSPPGNQHILPGNSSPSIDSAPLSDLSGHSSQSDLSGRSRRRSLKLIGSFLLPICASTKENFALFAP